jgi:hypothetical protein
MDKNKFWLGGRLFNTASQGWAPQRNARHVRKMGAQKQCKARPQVGRPNARPQCKRKARPQLGPQVPQPQRKTSPHVRKLGPKRNDKARPQDGRPNAKLIRNENVHTREH